MSMKKYGFIGLETAIFFPDHTVYLDYSPEVDRWFIPYKNGDSLSDNPKITFGTSMKHVHSLRAAKRHLRKHSEIPKGTVFRLNSQYVGFDIYLIKK